MKINKNRLVEQKLHEADDEEEVVVIDPSASVTEIEQDLEDNGEVDPTIADDIKDIANTINAEDSPVAIIDDDPGLKVESKITRILDDALEAAIDFKEEGTPERANVLICGLPGSGKTATVYDWSKSARTPNGEKIHIMYLNMKNNDLDAYINGYTIHQTIDQPEDDSDWDPSYDSVGVRQAYSHNLDDLDTPNTILFLDEYNRQVNDSIRASVLTLINEGYISGKGKKRADGKRDSRRYFPNLLFTIAVMNPHLATDLGAAELNDAEKSRFLHYIKHADSDPKTTLDYITKKKIQQINKELALGDKANLKRIEKYLRQYDLCSTIVKDADFFYDGRSVGDRPLSKADLALVLKELQTEEYKMFNQRSLTAAIEACRGKKSAFELYIDEDGTANWRPEIVEMLQGILVDYEDETLDDLIKLGETELHIAGLSAVFNKQATQPAASAAQSAGQDAEVQNAEDDPNYEDDEEIFANAAAANTIKISPAAVKSKIKSKIASW